MASHGVSRSAARPRTEEQRLAEAEKIKKYRDLEAQLRSELAQNNTSPHVFALTSRLLKLNPEYYTIWNDRRRLLISGSLSAPLPGSSPSRASPTSSPTATPTSSSADASSPSSTATRPAPARPTAGRSGTTRDPGDDVSDLIRAELAFTIPLLMEFPKCYWIWNYRLWVLGQAVQRLTRSVARAIWEEELGLVAKMLTRDRRNFHAWGYRRHVIAQLESAKLSDDGISATSLVASEFDYTTKMIRVDLSNFSAWHNRSKLIPRLLEERGADDAARRKFLDEELQLIRDALNVGPEDQSLWCYHQFLMLNLFDSVGPGSIAPHLALSDRVAYVNRELDDIKDLLEDYDNIKWLYEALVEYTIALAELEKRSLIGDELVEVGKWIGKLEELDPMRRGRWTDMRAQHGLT